MFQIERLVNIAPRVSCNDSVQFQRDPVRAGQCDADCTGCGVVQGPQLSHPRY
jgi:hypothetical protein